MVFRVIIFLCFAALPAVLADSEGGRFSRTHSFSGPFTSEHIPFWHYGGSAETNASDILLTVEGSNYNAGGLWNTVPCTLTDWEMEFDFKIQGQSDVGGEGFAFWFVEKADIIGTVFGSSDFWNGLGIFFDTYSNSGADASPIVTAVMNDGTQKYHIATDGRGQSLGNCSLQMRNLADLSSVKVSYRKESLLVSVALAADHGYHETFQECLHIDNVVLGLDKFFGFSAHTGGGHISDTHIVTNAHLYDFTPATTTAQDLEQARRKYDDLLLAKLTESFTSPPSVSAEEQKLAKKRDSDAFHHSVLNSLGQLQDEINMMEHEGINKGDFTKSQQLIATMNDRLNELVQEIHSLSSVQTQQQQLLLQQQTSFTSLKTDLQDTRAHTDAPRLLQSFHKEMEIANKKFTDLSQSHSKLQTALSSLLSRKDLFQQDAADGGQTSSSTFITLICGFFLGLLGAGVGMFATSSIKTEKQHLY